MVKVYIIINLKTISNTLTASGNIIHSNLNYKFMGLVSISRTPKGKIKRKQQIQKKISEKSVKAIKKNELLRKSLTPIS